MRIGKSWKRFLGDFSLFSWEKLKEFALYKKEFISQKIKK